MQLAQNFAQTKTATDSIFTSVIDKWYIVLVNLSCITHSNYKQTFAKVYEKIK